ncbi:hypothetical protein D3C81_1975550 [compost metagenome]
MVVPGQKRQPGAVELQLGGSQCPAAVSGWQTEHRPPCGGGGFPQGSGAGGCDLLQLERGRPLRAQHRGDGF